MLREPLLDPPKESNAIAFGVLGLSMASSSVGTLLLKWSQSYGSRAALVVGYMAEVVAFALYPVNLRYFSLQLVVVLWSACSNTTALLGGHLLFGDPLTVRSLVGCAMCVSGVLLVAG